MSELGSIIQGGGIVIGGVAFAKLLDIGYKVWAVRHQKTETEVKPNPLNVHVEKEMADKFVTKEEFDKHVEKVEKRLEAGNTAFKELRKEITGMREDLHAGLGKITDRISPIAEACAANGAAIRILLNEEKR